LIGEHVDYHLLPVLPIAIQRRVRLSFRPRADRAIRASSPQFGDCEFEWTPKLEAAPAGDWSNYVRAAAQCVGDRWNPKHGIDAEIESDLPAAAGLSSSSAILTAVTLALLHANGIFPTFEKLMDVLPEGEQFVGTRGGGMDHAAVLAGRAGCALLINFAPMSAEPVPIPQDWAFLVAHSLVTAEKSAALAAEYNARRTAGQRALDRLSLKSFVDADTTSLPDDERRAFRHVAGEAARVSSAVEALRADNAVEFGRLMSASHGSLRDLLRVSCAALDQLVEAAMESGALGARLTGAGFGGFAVILCHADSRDRVAGELQRSFYSDKPGFDPGRHLFAVEPSNGALFF
jgi:galactokinase